MANKSEKLIAFHGGLNDNSDAKDIAEDELSSAVDCSVSRVGRIGIIGGSDTALAALDPGAINPVKDYGMFYFSSDRDKDGKLLSEDWLALYDAGDGNVQFYYKDKQGSSPAIAAIVDSDFVESAKKAGAKPSFFIADGILRYSNGDFSSATNNRVHQYIDKGFFDATTVGATAHLSTAADLTNGSALLDNLVSTTALAIGDTVSGPPSAGIVPNSKVVSISGDTATMSKVVKGPTTADVDIEFTNTATVVRRGWVNSDQELKSFDDIFGIAGTGSLKIDKSDEAGPDATAISTELGTIVLSYWTSDDGQWNGSFQFAASPIYHQGGVGPISNFNTSINFHNNKVSFQLHIGLTGTVSATTHPFGDDRITGIRVFFRSHGSDKWHKLKDFDLLKGGKFNWKEYDSGTHTAFGIFDGDIGAISVTASNEFTLTGCYWSDQNESVSHPPDSRIKVGVFIHPISGQGSGIQSGSRVDSINTASSFEMDAPANGGSGSNVSLRFTTGSSQDRVSSYEQTEASFTVTNGASGFSDRYGFLRLWGPYNEPIWKNIDDSGDPITLETASHVMEITTPGEGEREFQVELLDETFQVVAQSTKQKITITDSGNPPPPTYEDNTGSS